MIKKCEWCGKEFDARGFSKYCLDCRPIVKREQHHKYQRRYYETHREQRHLYYEINRERILEYQLKRYEQQRLKGERQRIIAKLFERRQRS